MQSTFLDDCKHNGSLSSAEFVVNKKFKSTMPKFMLKVPLAQVLPVLPATLRVAPAHPRFWPQWFVKHAVFTPIRLTLHCSGSASPPTEFKR